MCVCVPADESSLLIAAARVQGGGGGGGGGTSCFVVTSLSLLETMEAFLHLWNSGTGVFLYPKAECLV